MEPLWDTTRIRQHRRQHYDLGYDGGRLRSGTQFRWQPCDATLLSTACCTCWLGAWPCLGSHWQGVFMRVTMCVCMCVITGSLCCVWHALQYLATFGEDKSLRVWQLDSIVDTSSGRAPSARVLATVTEPFVGLQVTLPSVDVVSFHYILGRNARSL